MAEVKRKAEAFDEIVNAVDESANSYELVARIKLEVLKYQNWSVVVMNRKLINIKQSNQVF